VDLEVLVVLEEGLAVEGIEAELVDGVAGVAG